MFVCDASCVVSFCSVLVVGCLYCLLCFGESARSLVVLFVGSVTTLIIVWV